MSITFVDPGPLPFINFSAPGTNSASYLSSPLYSQSSLWGVPPQTSIWNGTLTTTGNCQSGSQIQADPIPAYFFLQPTTYNSSTNITISNVTYPLTTTYPLFFALAAYNISLLHSFNPQTYKGDNHASQVIFPTNEIYVTSAIQFQHAFDNETTGFGYYVEEWDVSVASNGSLTGSCTTGASYDNLNACGTLMFPTGQDPLNCTGSLLPNFKQLYDVVNSTLEATLSDTSAVVNIRGFTSDGVGVALNFNGTFWTNSTAFSQLGVQDEHAVAPATSSNVWLYKPTSTVNPSKGAKSSTKPTTKPNAATRVEARHLGVLGGALLLVSIGVLGTTFLQ